MTRGFARRLLLAGTLMGKVECGNRGRMVRGITHPTGPRYFSWLSFDPRRLMPPRVACLLSRPDWQSMQSVTPGMA